jgi:hypothetical protein
MKKSIYRKSQITRAKPTRRLVKRRKIQAKKPRRGFFPNPSPPMLYIVTARAGGPKMHYDGTKFSQRARVRTYPTADAASKAALGLLKRYPVLRKYRIAVEPNRRF